ncbi:hypothetical protein [Streptomyces sp. NPDC059597]|uniref:hypothetical protein n=1 Tax=Streptomyces sp. NPDC059597 TaxID=3346879 RepID=UPI003694AB5D
MKIARSTLVTGAIAAAAAMAATGITYASAASGAVSQEAPAVAAAAPFGGSGSGNGSGQSKGNEGKGNEGNEGRGDKGGDHDYDEGRIQVNERSYSSRAGDCITVVSGLGAKSLNVRNDSRRTVEVFRGAVCDNGAPIAVVGPHSQSDGINPRHTEGVHVEKGVIGSFRVIRHHDDYDRD